MTQKVDLTTTKKSASQNEVLSVGDVANLCKLLDPTTGTTKTTTSSSASKLADSCFTGRQVMVPLTTKAFFSGKLQPPIAPSAASSSAGAAASKSKKEEGDWEKEMVLMNLGPKGVKSSTDDNTDDGSYYAEMNRKDAADVLRRRLESMMIIGHEQKLASSTKKPNETSHHEANQSAKQHPQDENTKTPGAPFLPYFEIREEYDSSGEVVKAEAIDVTEELKFLAKETKQEQNNNNKSSVDETQEEKGASSLEAFAEEKLVTAEEEQAKTTTSYPFSVAPANLEEPTSDVNDAELMLSSSSTRDDADGQDTENPSPINQVTSERYDAISSRLDQLILAEERYEKEKEINEQSSKKIKGKGWGKGFLAAGASQNKTRNQKREERPRQPKQPQPQPLPELDVKEQVVVSEKADRPTPVTKTKSTKITDPSKKGGGWGKGFLLDEDKKKTMSSPKQQPSFQQDAIQEKHSTRRVQFRESNEVREIPGLSMASGNNTNKTLHSAFSGVVTERKQQQPCAKPPQSTTPSRFESSGRAAAASSSSSSSSSPPPAAEKKKKMSRFAQRRLLERGGGG